MLIPSFGAYSLADDNITLLKPTFSPNDGLNLAALLIDISLQIEKNQIRLASRPFLVQRVLQEMLGAHVFSVGKANFEKASVGKIFPHALVLK